MLNESGIPPIDGYSVFCHLILTGLQIGEHLYLLEPTCITVPRESSARYLPFTKLSVLRNIVRSRLSPIGLYFKLNLSNRWKLSTWACISKVSIDKSYGVKCNDSKTCCKVRYFPSRTSTTSCQSASSYLGERLPHNV